MARAVVRAVWCKGRRFFAADLLVRFSSLSFDGAYGGRRGGRKVSRDFFLVIRTAGVGAGGSRGSVFLHCGRSE